MRHRILLWRLFATFAAVVLAAIVTMGGYAASALHTYTSKDTAATLAAHVDLASAALAPLIQTGEFAAADTLCKRIGRETGTRITIIRVDGIVVGDSFESIERMENHGDRSEIQAAIRGERGTDSRLSRTLSKRLTYLAVPVATGGRVNTVVRASLPVAPIKRMETLLRSRLGIGVVIGMAFAFAASWIAAGRLARPVTSIRGGATRVAGGDYRHRTALANTREFAQLTATINQLVSQLEERISESNRHRAEGEAILSSMIEGVLAVDTQSRVISMNGAAGELLGITAALAPGLPLDEAAPNREIQRFVGETLTQPSPIEAEFTLRADGGDTVHAQGTPLRDSDGKRNGAVIVLHDVTRLRRLEQVRRDFVANVSQELKTPITAIKGFVQTILETELQDVSKAKRSMLKVAKHAGRLNAIIEDLLALSRIEENADTGDRPFEERPLRSILEKAIQLCAVRAADKQIELALDCDTSLNVRMNPALLEQAVVNLVENAVQFSEDGGRVDVEGTRSGESVLINVTDHGCGIAAEHIPHLFERFYRVEPSQSGGTGLGLAIVQRIARAHDGAVRVASTAGEGSTFTIELPG